MIVSNGVKCHPNFFLLPKKFIAITLFGHVFFNIKEEELKKLLKKKEGKIIINHERIHLLQANSFKTKYLGFYTLYIWFWIKGLFKYGWNQSYYAIPFEREAYANERDVLYNETKWKNYVSY